MTTHTDQTIDIEVMNQSADLSDVEDAEELDLSSFKVDWLDLHFADCSQKLGICALPGCRYKRIWRSLDHDLSCLKEMKVENVFCLCTNGELKLFRASGLIEGYAEAGFTCHHHPIEDGQVPAMDKLMKLIEDVRVCLLAGKNTIVHCYGGLGRSCAVAACLMMVMDPNMTPEMAQEKLKALRGDAAIQSVKQYNFVNEFRDILNKYLLENKTTENRSVSR